jgi:hypothetical protein
VKLRIRLGWAAGTAGLAGVLLAGCGSAAAPSGAANGGGSGGGSANGSANGGTGSTAADAAGLCTDQDLAVSLGLGQVSAAAGSAMYPIDITNHSARGCRLDGYPDAWLAEASGARIGTAAAPDRAVPPSPVQLAPGGEAHVWLQVGTAANYPASTCHPETSRYLAVRVMDGGQVRSLSLALPACAGHLPAPGLMLLRPFEPGRGQAGAAG